LPSFFLSFFEFVFFSQAAATRNKKNSNSLPHFLTFSVPLSLSPHLLQQKQPQRNPAGDGHAPHHQHLAPAAARGLLPPQAAGHLNPVPSRPRFTPPQRRALRDFALETSWSLASKTAAERDAFCLATGVSRSRLANYFSNHKPRAKHGGLSNAVAAAQRAAASAAVNAANNVAALAAQLAANGGPRGASELLLRRRLRQEAAAAGLDAGENDDDDDDDDDDDNINNNNNHNNNNNNNNNNDNNNAAATTSSEGEGDDEEERLAAEAKAEAEAGGAGATSSAEPAPRKPHKRPRGIDSVHEVGADAEAGAADAATKRGKEGTGASPSASTAPASSTGGEAVTTETS
jgi:hypothetical protein